MFKIVWQYNILEKKRSFRRYLWWRKKHQFSRRSLPAQKPKKISTGGNEPPVLCFSFPEFRDVCPCRYHRWRILPAWSLTVAHVAGAKGPSSQGGPGSPGKPPSLVADSGTRRKRKRPSSPCRPRRGQDVSVSLCSLFRPNLLVLSSPSPRPSEILPKPLTPFALPCWVGLFLVQRTWSLTKKRNQTHDRKPGKRNGIHYDPGRNGKINMTKIPIPCEEDRDSWFV